jgi:hypothetical protein
LSSLLCSQTAYGLMLDEWTLDEWLIVQFVVLHCAGEHVLH